jgi:integrase
VIDWRARLTPEQREQATKWRRAHRWHPHRLRHNAGTELRRDSGAELARIVLGHKSLDVTEIYAEADRAKAFEALRRIG